MEGCVTGTGNCVSNLHLLQVERAMFTDAERRLRILTAMLLCRG